MKHSSLWISDVHMDKGLPYAKPSEQGRTDRLDDQIALWARVKNAAIEREIQDVWIIGDLFNNSRPDAVTLTATASCIADLLDADLRVYLLPGNHDAIGVSGGRFTLEAFGALRRPGLFYVGDRPFNPVEIDGVKIWAVQYMPTPQALETIQKIQTMLDPDDVNVLALHQSIVGCTHIGWTCDDGLDGAEICVGFDGVFSGHFHDAQRFGADRVGMYLGAPMHHNYGDKGRRAGFWHAEIRDSGRIKREFIDGGAPKFHEIDWGSEAPPTQPGDYLRFRVRATHAELAAIRPAIEDAVKSAQSSGLKASYRHDPVYHHGSRLDGGGESDGEAALLKGEDLVSAYVDASGVDTKGLDKAELKRIGLQMMATARSGA